MSWKLILIELTGQLIAHVMYLGDEVFFSPFLWSSLKRLQYK